MIKTYALHALQIALNKCLALDETMPAKLADLDGSVLEIMIEPLGPNFFICFSRQGLQLESDYQGRVDTTIRSNPIGLIRLSLLPAAQMRSLFKDKLRLSGDVELGQKVKKLFDELDIDWEGHLASFTGDGLAHYLGNTFRQALNLKKQLSQSFSTNLKEYLQEEYRLFPSREESNDFFNDIDNLVLDVERMQAKINQLMNNL